MCACSARKEQAPVPPERHLGVPLFGPFYLPQESQIVLPPLAGCKDQFAFPGGARIGGTSCHHTSLHTSNREAFRPLGLGREKARRACTTTRARPAASPHLGAPSKMRSSRQFEDQKSMGGLSWGLWKISANVKRRQTCFSGWWESACKDGCIHMMRAFVS